MVSQPGESLLRQELYNVDGGYFTLAQMRRYSHAGRFWLTSVKAGTLLFDGRDQCWDRVSFLLAQPGDEVDVWPGKWLPALALGVTGVIP